jgi:secernin
MCDTFGIGPELTGSGTSIFGKNSDREPDEAQLVVSLPARSHAAGEALTCTYVTIPQASSTYAVVLSKPYWLWGAEMGVNEKGVAIGNEALFTKVKPEKTPGLIGMDLLRLALERGADAEEAVHVIIALLKRHGQSGPCGHRDKKFTYMNSFLVMDRRGIIKLETAGRNWASKRFTGCAVISNGITITKDWNAASVAAGTDFSSLSDPLTTFFSGSAFRRSCNERSILAAKGRVSAGDAFAMLRRHHGPLPGFGFNRDVCMHASDPLIRRSQTTGSMVVELWPDDKMRIFVTGGSAPCLTAFKPFLPAAPLADLGVGAGSYAAESYWWRHAACHISAALRYAYAAPLLQAALREIEARWQQGFRPHSWECTDPVTVELSHRAFREAEAGERAALEHIDGRKITAGTLSAAFWKHLASRAGVPFI